METLAASWQWILGVVGGAVLAVANWAYKTGAKVARLEHEIAEIKKDQEEHKEILTEIRSDIKSILRQSAR